MWFNKCKNGHDVADMDVIIPALSKASINCRKCGVLVYSYDKQPKDMRLIMENGKITITYP